jgi:hypothetical protein
MINKGNWEKYVLGCHFINHTSHLKLPGIELEAPHWEASVGFSCGIVSISRAVIFSYITLAFVCVTFSGLMQSPLCTCSIHFLN